MHQDAALAAEASLEAYKQKGNDGFWTMHDLLFDNQEAPESLKPAALIGYASRMGLDLRAFRAALESRSHRTEVEADRAAAEAAGISGTPSFVINGYFVSGAQPFAKFRKVIDRALAEAK
jgi:protein-disulfide isomerase